jgi:hypothetical protein
VLVERLRTGEQVGDGLVQRDLIALPRGSKQIASLRRFDVQYGLLVSTSATTAPASTSDRSGTYQAVTMAVSLLTSVVGMTIRFMRQPLQPASLASSRGLPNGAFDLALANQHACLTVAGRQGSRRSR